MSNFTASNGLILNERGYVISRLEVGSEKFHEARKEFYQHLRDEELGRWRDPEAPNFVVYNSGIEYVRVVNEATGCTEEYRRDRTDSSGYGETAARYFAAHPAGPWHDAEPGEIWVLEFGGDKRAYARTATLFTNWDTPSLHPTDTGIKSGYRIWPEEAK